MSLRPAVGLSIRDAVSIPRKVYALYTHYEVRGQGDCMESSFDTRDLFYIPCRHIRDDVFTARAELARVPYFWSLF